MAPKGAQQTIATTAVERIKFPYYKNSGGAFNSLASVRNAVHNAACTVAFGIQVTAMKVLSFRLNF